MIPIFMAPLKAQVAVSMPEREALLVEQFMLFKITTEAEIFFFWLKFNCRINTTTVKIIARRRLSDL
jgi:hypothetical protein